MFLDRSKCRGKSIKITSFWDQFSTILFPFKYKFLPFLETKRAIVVREFFLSFSFWGCLFSKKISSKFFKKIFLNGFSKKKWVNSLNTHLSFFWVWVKTQFLLDGASRRRPRSSLERTPNMFLKMKAWWRGVKVLVK